MSKQFFCLLILMSCLLHAVVSRSAERDTSGVWRARAYLLLGGADTAADWGEMEPYTETVGYGDGHLKMRFAGGGGFAVDAWIRTETGLTLGVDFIGKGYRAGTDDYIRREYLRCLEMPIGLRFNIRQIRLDILWVPGYTVFGKYEGETGSDIVGRKYVGNDWDSIRRLNLSSRVVLGYGFQFNRIIVVPGVMWEMSLLNAAAGEQATDFSIKMRQINLMFSASLELPL